MAVATIERALERPQCDWDSPRNPSLDTWTTVNLAEVFPGVASPFDASWYHRWQTRYLRRATRQLEIEDLVPLYEWPVPNFLGFFAGQCAANVALTTAIVASYQVDGGSTAVEQFFTADQPGAARATSLADRERARRTRARFFRVLSQIPNASHSDLERASALAQDVAALDTGALSLPELRRWLGRVEALAEHTFLHHALTSLGGAEYSSMLGEHLATNLPDVTPDAVLTLTSGLGQVESARPSRALWELSRWVRQQPELRHAVPALTAAALRAKMHAAATDPWRGLRDRFAQLMRDYGYRGQTEWMLALPDWHEDPTFPLNSLRNMVSAPDSGGPDELHSAATARRIETERSYRERLPRGARARYDELLDRAQRFVRLREFTKANCIRGVRPGRRIALAMGDRLTREGFLATADDIFFLFAQEVDEIMAGNHLPAEVKWTVTRRQAQKAALEEGYVLPDNFSGAPTIRRRTREQPSEGGTLTGLAVSAGTATGTARVVMDIEEANAVSLEAGDILVAPFTDAPWTALFLVAGAVVVETGGVLSHAATVAREFGIPAVVMVKDATRIIADGQRVTVDGAAGTVTLH